MNNQKNNNSRLPDSRQDTERRILPFFIEFVKFTTGFAVIVAAALLMLNVATATM